MAPTRPPRSRSPENWLEAEVPDVDDPPSPAELAHAASFAALLDKAERQRLPPALDTDERALLETATVLRAAGGELHLDERARNELITSVLEATAEARRAAHGAGVRRVSTPMRAHPPPPGKSWRWRAMPWALAAASMAAAASALWLRVPQQVVVQRAAPVPAAFTSRPADAVVGEISRAASGEAARRIDSIYSDRLDGYRTSALFRQGDVR